MCERAPEIQYVTVTLTLVAMAPFAKPAIVGSGWWDGHAGQAKRAREGVRIEALQRNVNIPTD